MLLADSETVLASGLEFLIVDDDGRILVDHPFALRSAVAPPQPAFTSRINPMPFIAAKDGAELYWREWGAGAPILFLNSLGCGSRMWDYQIAAFADEGFRCIGFDRRGHGRSDQPARGYDFDTFADDVAALVDHARSFGPHAHRPFDGGRRGGALSHAAWG